jgi:transposase
VLLFFDTKVVPVKAYGGRRYTSAPRRPVLPRRQKTRGRFYLFAAYEVNTGRTRWAFPPGKGADEVCRFARRLRRWYPGVPLWLALDQDRAHPCKCRQARRALRALKIHWVSLPKGSPDDNPVETVFSDVQGSVLEASDDPDPRATQRRITAHLRGRNRRRDRRIRIPYLPDPPGSYHSHSP